MGMIFSNKMPFPSPFSFSISMSCTNGCLRLAGSLCPFVTHVNIRNLAGVTDSELLGLRVLERLTDLQISNIVRNVPNACLITYDGGLAPLLKAVGASLKTLTLVYLPIFICLSSVIEYCPNLNCLNLCCRYSTSDNGSEEEVYRPAIKRAKTVFVWNDLKQLRISNIIYHNRFHEAPLEELLLSSSPDLEELVFFSCDNLSDDVLRHVFQFRSFNSLERLEFWNCDYVSKVGIDFFMNGENNLKKLGIMNCQSVSVEAIVHWKAQAKMRNWDLEVIVNDQRKLV